MISKIKFQKTTKDTKKCNDNRPIEKFQKKIEN